jgi:phosphate transport system substrate-binding protein
MGRCLITAGLALAASLADAQPWNLDSLPPYRPQQAVSGVVRGYGSSSMKKLITNWEAGFVKHHPSIVFADVLTGAATAIGGLNTGVADVGVVGREIWPIEIMSFYKTYDYEPLEIMVATGTYDTNTVTFAQAILVRKDNPISKLTMKQLDGIFGAERTGGMQGITWKPELARSAKENIRAWGQLGLPGDWADKPIHVYGYTLKLSGESYFFEKAVFHGGDKWNPALLEFADISKPDGTRVPPQKQLMDALSNDPYGIGYTNIKFKTPQLKPVALAAADGGPYVELSRENVQNRTYPLSRSVYFYLNRAPGAPLAPKVREFLRYILSREGQEAVSRTGEHLPLTEELVRAELKKLE